MKDGSLFKLRILLKSIEIFRNWYLYPLVYFNLTNKPFVIFETKTGLKLKIRTKSTDLMALTHVWLIEEYDNPDLKISNNDTIVDIGAHIGLFSLFAAQFCKKGRVFCFEPVSDNYELLLENIKDVKKMLWEDRKFLISIAIEYHFADSKPDLLEELIKKLKKSFNQITTRELFSDIGFLFAKRK